MTEQTTVERIRDLLLDRMGFIDGTYGAVRVSGVAKTIAAEIDGLRAEIARLKPAAEAWMSLPEDVQIDAEVSAAARERP